MVLVQATMHMVHPALERTAEGMAKWKLGTNIGSG